MSKSRSVSPVVEDAVDELVRTAAAQPRVLSMGGGLPSPRQFPRRALTDALADAVFTSAASALQYGWPEGSPGLRAAIARQMARRGMVVEPERIVVTSGAQQAIMLAAQHACRRDARILTEPATYPAALNLFKSLGIESRAIDGTIKRRAAGAIYAMPTVSNPTGLAISSTLRAAMLASRLPIIEDDAYGDLRFDGRGRKAMAREAPDRVFYVGTFSKTLAPGLRIGWLVPPERHLDEILAAKRDTDLQANGLGQSMVEGFLRETNFAARLRRLRAYYRGRAERLANAVRRELPAWQFEFPEGGFALWLHPDQPRCRGGELGLLRAAVKAGVSFDVGSRFRPDGATSPLALRLCFSAVETDALATGARRLARAWRAVTRSRRRR